MFWSVLQRTGRFVSAEMALLPGPRHCGQLSANASCAHNNVNNNATPRFVMGLSIGSIDAIAESASENSHNPGATTCRGFLCADVARGAFVKEEQL
jgi:hypothetical protein